MRIVLLAVLFLVSACGSTIKPVTNIYIFGDNNKVTETMRTDNKPETTAPISATVPVIP